MVCGYEATVLPLKRMIPPSHELDLTQLMTFDSARHGRLLQSPVHGSFNWKVERDTSILLSAYDPYISILLFLMFLDLIHISKYFLKIISFCSCFAFITGFTTQQYKLGHLQESWMW